MNFHVNSQIFKPVCVPTVCELPSITPQSQAPSTEASGKDGSLSRGCVDFVDCGVGKGKEKCTNMEPTWKLQEFISHFYLNSHGSNFREQ